MATLACTSRCPLYRSAELLQSAHRHTSEPQLGCSVRIKSRCRHTATRPPSRGCPARSNPPANALRVPCVCPPLLLLCSLDMADPDHNVDDYVDSTFASRYTARPIAKSR